MLTNMWESLINTDHLPGFGVSEMIDALQGVFKNVVDGIVAIFRVVTGSL